MADHSRKRPRFDAEAATSTETSRQRTSAPPPHIPPRSPPNVPSLSVSTIGRQMRRTRPDSVTRIHNGAPVYMTAVLEYLTHEVIDAAALQAKKQHQQQQQHRKDSSTTDRAAAATEAVETTAHSAVDAGESTETVERSADMFGDNDADESGMGWLCGEPTITPSHLAAVFHDNDDWAALIREFDQQPTTTPMQPTTATPPTSQPDTSTQPATLQPNDTFSSSLSPPQPTPTPLLSLPSTHAVDTPHTSASTDTNTQHIKQSTLQVNVCTFNALPTSAVASVDSGLSRVRERGTRSHRPTLRASRGWAGGSKGDSVSRYQPVVRRAADGRICVYNPFA